MGFFSFIIEKEGKNLRKIETEKFEKDKQIKKEGGEKKKKKLVFPFLMKDSSSAERIKNNVKIANKFLHTKNFHTKREIIKAPFLKIQK